MSYATELTNDAGTNVTTVWVMYSPLSAEEREAKRKALRAEARAWRTLARKLNRYQRATFLCWHADEAMQCRVNRHLEPGQCVMLHGIEPEMDPANNADRVLACLFLELECLDELASLRQPRKAVKR